MRWEFTNSFYTNPIPWVTNNEQQKNAEVLKSTGLATIIPEAELTPENYK